MRKRNDTVRYTAKQIKARIAKGEDRTNWDKVGAVTGAKLEASIRADADDLRNWLVASSRYATQLREYLRRFDRDRVSVIDLADLAADTPEVMSGVFDFLGLEQPTLEPEDFRLFNTR